VQLFPLTHAAAGLTAIVFTPDGALWGSLSSDGALVRRDSDGQVAEFALGSGSRPLGLAAATDDSVWVADEGLSAIARVGKAGILAVLQTPTPDAGPTAIAALEDGTAWFIERALDGLGRIDIIGRLTEYASVPADSQPVGIASSGESLWVSLPQASAVAYFRGGDSRALLHPMTDAAIRPQGIVTATGGAVYFTAPGAGQVGRIAAPGSSPEIIATLPGSHPADIVADAFGGCWFTLDGEARIGHLSAEGELRLREIPEVSSGIAIDSGGAIWMALASGGLLCLHPLEANS
jgi:virginiamycin B lyase